MDYLVTQIGEVNWCPFLTNLRKISEIISDTYFTIGKKQSLSRACFPA